MSRDKKFYEPTIGLEVHVELNTKSKMFCSCRNNPNATIPNSEICPVCMGHPGTLPVINKEAVRKVMKTGLALNCEIAKASKFDRKNYFYPDLPKGYQISQYDMPFCKQGFLEINGRKIRITRIHLEEDTGRLAHLKDEKASLVDFNRAGVPLMELVTEPDITSGKEAKAFAQELQLILRYLGVSEADMEKGQMRVEVNISLSKTKKLGTKVEIKNINSFRSVERSIDYEIERQAEVLGRGEKIIQETRGWDDPKGITFSQREKEEAHDYRYLPEPDLPTLHFEEKFFEEIKAEIPELPQEKRKRMKQEYGLDENIAIIFSFQKDLSEYFEKVVSEFDSGLLEEKLAGLIKLALNYLISDVLGALGNKEFIEKDFKITPENFAEFISLIEKGEISSRTAKDILKIMMETGKDPSNIIDEKGLKQTNNEQEIEKIASEIVSQNQNAAGDYKKGKKESLQFLVGKIMAATRGKANPEMARKILEKILS